MSRSSVPEDEALSPVLRRRIDQACNGFEAAQRAGAPPPIEEFLDDWEEPERSALLRELILLDLDYRRGRGEKCQVEDYLGRFPEVDAVWLAGELAKSAVALPSTIDHRRAGETLELAPPLAVGSRFGDYEILEEIGRGAMGVVYKARQVSLDRFVALKMILSGEHANPQELARFRTEAQAIARLQHPNIVQIHEVGEHGGRPFFSLEFCTGGNLDKKLNGTPLPAQEAARLIEVLARAMHPVHQEKIVHRDLKPANVLLAADGTAKITDFGLAKKLDEPGATQSGAIMGTPSYMAPEQAAGKQKVVGPLADVYALGAILYECLTGRPPFKAATVMDTLMQVMMDDPVPPRQLQSKTPRDLETICLKCLRKEPAKRYANALELAEDLRRFQAGKPIKARPVGARERAAKWVRRQPVLAGFMALFAISLISGTTVSMYLGILASYRADRLEDDVKTIKGEQGKTAAALEKSDANLKRSQERLADGLLRPIGRDRGPLDPVEWKSLWELAALPKEEDPVRTLFIDRALEHPETAEQLEYRSAIAVHAAVGLDRARREQVLGVLRMRLQQPEADGRVRVACAMAVAELTPVDETLADEAAQAIVDAIGDAVDTKAFQLRMQSPSFQIDDTKSMASKAKRLPALRRAIWAVGPWLDAAGAAAAARKLLDAMDKEPSQEARLPLSEALAAVAPRLDAAEARQASRRILDAMDKEPNPYNGSPLSEALAAVAPRLDAAGASKAARKILDAMDKDLTLEAGPAGGAAGYLSKALAAVAPRLDAAGARETAATAARKILDAMDKHPSLQEFVYLSEALADIAPLLDAARGREITAAGARKILDAMEEDPSRIGRVYLSKALAAVALRLDAAAAVAAARRILDAMDKDPNPDALGNLGKALAAVAPRLDAAAAVAAARKILDAMDKHPDLDARLPLSEALAAVAPRLDEAGAHETATAAVRRILDAMEQRPDSFALWRLGRALAGVASRLDDATAREAAYAAAQKIIDSMAKERLEQTLLFGLRDAWAGSARQLDAPGAAAAAKRILDAMDKEYSSPITPGNLGWAFEQVAPRLDAAGAAAVAGMLLEETAKDPIRLEDPTWLRLLGGGSAEATSRADAELSTLLSFRLVGGGPAEPTAKDPVRGAVNPAGFSLLVAKLGCQGKVDLLKHPACVGPARDAVMFQIGNELHHPFNDIWDLVDWLEEHNPEVDVLTPPRPPGP